MQKLRFFTIMIMSILLISLYACNKSSDQSEHAEKVASSGEHAEKVASEGEHSESGEGRSEHEGEHGGEGEESGPQLSKGETHDEIRKGVRLILSYDSESSSFTGTVENVTDRIVPRVRIEVHLSNGTELGPTTPIDLAPGKKVNVKLSAEGHSFNWWKAHAEAGQSEHRSRD